jgi:ADP-heptose:LPS heptosyltransferase
LIFWGNKAERASAERLAQAVPEVLLAPDTPLPELGALLSRCGVLVSGDTGPLHLAFAHGTPCIGLFGPVPHERNGPRGTRHRCFQAPSEPWERKDVTKARMDQISVDTVVDTCMELAKENG